MRDFLSRLIQRTSGRVPSIRPLVRSSYDTLPIINESATEFEETVTFNDETVPVPPLQKALVSQMESPEITGKSDVQETRELVKTIEEPEIRLTPDINQNSIRQESQLSPRAAQENEKMVSPERETAPIDKTEEIKSEIRGQDYNGLSWSETAPQIQSQVGQTREKGAVNRQRPLSRRLQPEAVTYPKSRQVFDRIPQTLPAERIDVRQREIVETIEETQLVSPDVFLPERERSNNLETGRLSELGHPVNLTRQYRIEDKSPSVNVRVSIGRVEVKAIQQSEPRTQRKPSVPLGPAISLDAYLKGRDEERR